jgi:hypothetical protein
LFLGGGGALPANQIKLGKLNFRFSIESRQYPTEMRNAAEYIDGGGEDNVVSLYLGEIDSVEKCQNQFISILSKSP